LRSLQLLLKRELIQILQIFTRIQHNSGVSNVMFISCYCQSLFVFMFLSMFERYELNKRLVV
jgi:hypothetical protein